MASPPVEPGTRYGPWVTIEYKGNSKHLAVCLLCHDKRELSTHALCTARRRGYKKCRRGCAALSKKKRHTTQKKKRDARRIVWTGSEWITQTEAAKRLGISRQRVNQLVKKHKGNLEHRWES